MILARIENLQIKWIVFIVMYLFVLFSVLNRTWETVKRTGNKKSVSADGKTQTAQQSLLYPRANEMLTAVLRNQNFAGGSVLPRSLYSL